MSALEPRARLAAGLGVGLIAAAQTAWMGSATLILSLGLFATWGLWGFTAWQHRPGRILPRALVAVLIQGIHFAEEVLTGFQREFPALFGQSWSDSRFITFNLVWLTIFTLAAFGAKRGIRLAYLPLIFLALVGGLGNGLAHVGLSLAGGAYFPGTITAPLCFVAGFSILRTLYRQVPEGE